MFKIHPFTTKIFVITIQKYFITLSPSLSLRYIINYKIFRQLVSKYGIFTNSITISLCSSSTFPFYFWFWCLYFYTIYYRIKLWNVEHKKMFAFVPETRFTTYVKSVKYLIFKLLTRNSFVHWLRLTHTHTHTYTYTYIYAVSTKHISTSSSKYIYA